MDKRTRARALAMQALYQLDVQGKAAFDSMERFFTENQPDDQVRKLARQWVREAWTNVSVCDELISKAVLRWQISRLSLVDKSILRLAVYQLKFCEDIPPRVVINEAIELAKKFGTAQSSGFVNGVLDAILKTLQQTQSARSAD